MIGQFQVKGQQIYTKSGTSQAFVTFRMPFVTFSETLCRVVEYYYAYLTVRPTATNLRKPEKDDGRFQLSGLVDRL